MSSSLIIFGVAFISIVALVFAARKWGINFATKEFHKDTAKEVIRISGEASDARKEVGSLSDASVDERLHDIGGFRTDK